jgi:hypothetical protein
MSSALVGARYRRTGKGMLRYDNPRARILGGGCLLIMGLVGVSSAAAAPSLGGAVAFGVLSAVVLLLGLRVAYAFTFKLSPPFLELRFAFHTTRVPLGDIDGCRPRSGSRGLIYNQIYPEFVLKDGRLLRFNLIQWSPRRPEKAQEACQHIAASIRDAAH